MKEVEQTSSEGARFGAVGAFLDRLGGMIIAPRATLARFADGGPGGFNDLLLLLLLLEAGRSLPSLARGAWTLVDVSVVTGVLTMVRILTQQMIVPLVAVVIGSVLLKALGPRGQEARHLDAAALCALPAVGLKIGLSLAGMVLRDFNLATPPWPQVVQGVSAAWFVALLFVALALSRRELRKTTRRR